MLEWAASVGEICLKYLDESGFNLYRNLPRSVLLRESYRDGKKVRKRTLANLSKLPDNVVDNLQLVLKGSPAVKKEKLPNICEINRSLPPPLLSLLMNNSYSKENRSVYPDVGQNTPSFYKVGMNDRPTNKPRSIHICEKMI